MKPEFKSDPVKSMLFITVGFLLLYLVFKLEWALKVSLIFGLSGILSQRLSLFFEKVWFAIAAYPSRIMPLILLTFIYFCILFPIALLSRLFRKSEIVELKNTKLSMFKEHSIEYNKSYFENMW